MMPIASENDHLVLIDDTGMPISRLRIYLVNFKRILVLLNLGLGVQPRA